MLNSPPSGLVLAYFWHSGLILNCDSCDRGFFTLSQLSQLHTGLIGYIGFILTQLHSGSILNCGNSEPRLMGGGRINVSRGDRGWGGQVQTGGLTVYEGPRESVKFFLKN